MHDLPQHGLPFQLRNRKTADYGRTEPQVDVPGRRGRSIKPTRLDPAAMPLAGCQSGGAFRDRGSQIVLGNGQRGHGPDDGSPWMPTKITGLSSETRQFMTSTCEQLQNVGESPLVASKFNRSGIGNLDD